MYAVAILMLFNYAVFIEGFSLWGFWSVIFPLGQIAIFVIKRRELLAWETAMADICVSWLLWVERCLRNLFNGQK